MNNSKIAFDSVLTLEETDNSEVLREEEARLVRIIEVINGLNKSVEWSTLKKEIFDGRVESLERQLRIESESLDIKDSNIYRLQGRLFESRKYDLDKLGETYRVELSRIKKLIQPTER